MLQTLSLLLAIFAGGHTETPTAAVDTLDAEIDRAWVCPLHPESHHGGEGPCEVCSRPRELRAMTHRWTCPMHARVTSAQGGTCEVCGMGLVPRTFEVVWRCSRHEDVAATEPGVCRHDGTALEPQLLAWAHGDHNPRHGGLFFMAADRFHHIEGTLRDGHFTLYVYDNFTRPVGIRGIRARVGGARLAPTADGRALATAIDDSDAAGSGDVTLFVDFGSGTEYRFDFVFSK